MASLRKARQRGDIDLEAWEDAILRAGDRQIEQLWSHAGVRREKHDRRFESCGINNCPVGGRNEPW